MKNFELAVINHGGTSIPFIFENGRDLVTWLAGTDHHENVQGVMLECFADDGRRISIFISNDDSTQASLSIHEDSKHPTPPRKAR